MTNNWQTKKLGEVTTIIRGASPRPKGDPRYFGGNIPWIKISDVTRDIDNKYVFKTVEGLTDEGKRRSVFLDEGTLILTNSATVGLPKILATSGCIHDGFLAFSRISQDLLKEYIYYFLLSKREQLSQKAYSGTQKNLNTTIVKRFEISYPSVITQKTVVERLETIKNLQELNQREIKKTRELFNSFLATVFKPQKGGVTKNLDELFTRGSKTILPVTLGEQLVNYIGLENIESNTGRLISFSPCSAETIKSAKTKFNKGDILYGKLRPYLNKVWFATMDGICSTDIWVLKAKEDEILPELLPLLLRLPEIVKKTLAGMTGTNLPRVNAKSFNNIEVSIVPIDQQRILIEKVMTIQAYQQKLQIKKETLTQLFSSALNKYMSPN